MPGWELGWVLGAGMGAVPAVPFPLRFPHCATPIGCRRVCHPPVPLGATRCPRPTGPGSLGRCFSEWQCQDGAGGHNDSAMSRAECCQHPWGHSWRRGDTGDSGGPCLPCTRLPLGGDGGSARHRSPPATCQAWAGTRFRTFDGRHFGFGGTCRYSLATATDGTWDVTVSLGHRRVPGTGGRARAKVGMGLGWTSGTGMGDGTWDVTAGPGHPDRMGHSGSLLLFPEVEWGLGAGMAQPWVHPW